MIREVLLRIQEILIDKGICYIVNPQISSYHININWKAISIKLDPECLIFNARPPIDDIILYIHQPDFFEKFEEYIDKLYKTPEEYQEFQFANGYNLYWKDNEVGGRTYYTDENDAMFCVWDTTLVSIETLKEAIALEEKSHAKRP